MWRRQGECAPPWGSRTQSSAVPQPWNREPSGTSSTVWHSQPGQWQNRSAPFSSLHQYEGRATCQRAGAVTGQPGRSGDEASLANSEGVKTRALLLLRTAAGNIKWCCNCGKQFGGASTGYRELPLTRQHHFKDAQELKRNSNDTHTPRCTVASFTTADVKEQPKCPPARHGNTKSIYDMHNRTVGLGRRRAH